MASYQWASAEQVRLTLDTNGKQVDTGQVTGASHDNTRENRAIASILLPCGPSAIDK